MTALSDLLSDVSRRGGPASVQEAFAASWDTFRACFHEWLTTVHASARPTETGKAAGFMTKASIQQILKYLKLLTHAQRFETRRGSGVFFNLMALRYGGERLTMDHDLVSVYACAADCVARYDLRKDYWQLLHPINKLNLFKKYLEGKGVVFRHAFRDCHKRKRNSEGTAAVRKRRKATKRPSRTALKSEWNAVKKDIREISSSAALSAEERRLNQRRIINRSRKGQGTFRKGLIDECDGRCPATCVNDPVFLEAAHLVPWSTAKNQELDNGILLYATVHIAMDRGYLTFDEDGRLWRRRDADICHLHIRCAQLPEELLTPKRRAWLKKAHAQWLGAHRVTQGDLCKVVVAQEASTDGESENNTEEEEREDQNDTEAEDTAGDTAEDTAGDTAGDTAEDTTGDTAEDTAEDTASGGDIAEQNDQNEAEGTVGVSSSWQERRATNWERLQIMLANAPSAYERARLQRIKENNAELVRLGLSPIRFT